ncbi:ATP-dependent RNA helicase RhlE [Capsulimonas corticalis]|uniref:RNA helicase n=1 Tax=Capsulimonas corticalis TaxID=2219043 RepID=A0A402D3G3_9BACT|nr:DEAD/DEAH box helicase [Capsulimonas corticalis]BDI28565.1 ATP-dependent RNA helicase RhlE [Capsulimonas corticalis]
MSFTSLGLRPEILRALSDSGYETPTPIQSKAIPVIMQGRDVLAAAQTGTGKTAGFTLPLLHRLSTTPQRASRGHHHPVRALIVTPTRELAAQVEESVTTYGKHLNLTSAVVFGGVNINPQIAALRHGVDILVATPGRLLDHIQQGTVDLTQVEVLVLDEADRMLDMGFIRDIKKILALLPAKRQNLLFSATFSDEIKSLANGLLNSPTLVEVARQNAESELVTHCAYFVAQENKRDLLEYLLIEKKIGQALVFTRTKHGADRLAKQLTKSGINALAIHGNKSQPQRTKALADFKSSTARILVATDIAARGIDIDQLPHVINYELPNVPEDYIHRIGRTGRAGSPGEALSLVSRDEESYLADIERKMKKSIPRQQATGFIPKPASVTALENADTRPPRPPRPQPRQSGPGQRPSGSGGRPPMQGPRGDRPQSQGSQGHRPGSSPSSRPAWRRD